MISCVPKYNKTVISILLISFLISIIAVPVYGQAEVGFMYGDVNENGKIDVGDTILILRHIVDLIDLAEIEGYALFAADVSANNEIDVFDAIYLLRRITGLSAEGDFPAEIRLADAEAIVTLAEESRASDLDVVRRAIEILLPDIPPRAELNARLDALEGLIAAIDAANAAIDALPDPADLTEDDIDAIKAARDLVNAAQELGAIDEDFTDPDKLEAAEAYIAALEAVVAAEESQLRADMDAAWELVNALPEGNSKDELKARLEAIEVLSAYGFEFNEPEKVVAGEEAVVPVTFKAVEEEDLGYDKVRFSFEVTARPGEDAEVTFKATDSLGTEHTFTNEGVWGPSGGFPISKDYEATTDWTLLFSEGGPYTITFRLTDLDTEAIIVEDSVTIDVLVPVHSAYGFEFNEPEKVVAGEEAVVPVTFKAVEEEDLGYDKVRFSFEVTARPGEDAEVTFKATDSLGTEHTFTNEGVWGPSSGFPISKDYEATTDWTLLFSEGGPYTITFRLTDLDTEAIIVEDSVTIDVLVPVHSAYGFEFNEPEKVVAGEEAVVPVTFKAVEEEDLGYDKVRFSFEVTARPGEDAEVTFKATDSLGTEHTFTNEGVWGPSGGFPISKDYEATTDWTLLFSEGGPYTITFRLTDLDTGEVIVESNVMIQVGGIEV